MVTTYRITASIALAAMLAGSAACSKQELTLDMPENQLITSIELHVSRELPLGVGMDSTINFTKAPQNPDLSGLIWKSSNELVASVDQNGTIHALQTGKTTITVTPEWGFGNDRTSPQIVVTVIPEVKKVSKIEFNNTVDELYEGDQMQLTATLWPADHTYSHLLWQSTDPSVASVDQNGLVSGIKAGSADIVAWTHDGGKASAKYHINVMKSVPAQEVALVPHNGVLYLKQPLQLEVTTVPADATLATLQWTSSDESVLTVENGLVVAQGFGTASVTATCSATGNSSSIELTVDPGFYIWDNTNSFHGYSINSSIGKFAVTGGVMECSVTEDANARIYFQACAASTAKNMMSFDFAKYPIVALLTDSGMADANWVMNIANLGNTISVGKNMTKQDLGNGKAVIYYDGAAHAEFADETGLTPVRVFCFKVTKSKMPVFSVYQIRVFKSIDEMNEAYGQ